MTCRVLSLYNRTCSSKLLFGAMNSSAHLSDAKLTQSSSLNSDMDTPDSHQEKSKTTDHSIADFVTSLSVVLGVWQVIPAIFESFSSRLTLMLLAVAAGIALYLKLRNRVLLTRTVTTWAIPAALAIVVGAWVLYNHYSMRAALANYIKAEQKAKAEELYAALASKLHDYLDTVYKEHAGQWNGEFEKRYARPTLYLLSSSGVETKPLDVQRAILRWRSGSEDVSRAFNGMVVLTGEPLGAGVDEGSKDLLSKHALRFMDHVVRPMADTDLLNKRTRPSSDGVAPVVADDVPERILVLGDPAAGKSTMLERLDMVQARRARGSASEAVPVLLKLKGIKNPSPEKLLEMVASRLGDCADHVFSSRGVALLIDALDEAEDPAAAVKAVAELASSKKFVGGVDRVIVTGRVLNYSTDIHTLPDALRFKGFSTAILYGLDQTAIEKQVLGSSFTSDQKARIMQKLVESPTRSAWLQFLRLPMNFDLIGEIMADLDVNDIGQGQAEIMRRFIARRFEQKGLSSQQAANALALLTRVSLRLIEPNVAGRSRDFSAADAVDGAAPDDGALKNAEGILAEIQSSGLIRQTGPGRYRFFHLNVQDYFTALGLTSLDKVDASQTAWRQILLFLAGTNRWGLVEKTIAEQIEKSSNPYLEELQIQMRAARRMSESEPSI
jgi:uncharacterized membrane protein (DUF485 family)